MFNDTINDTCEQYGRINNYKDFNTQIEVQNRLAVDKRGRYKCSNNETPFLTELVIPDQAA